MTHEQATRALNAIGAGWCGSSRRLVLPDDPRGTRPCYHVHPVRARPDASAILRFRSLAEVSRYVRFRRAANAEPDEAKRTELWLAHQGAERQNP